MIYAGDVSYAGMAGQRQRTDLMTDRMMQFFAYAHLPTELQIIGQRFYTLAEWLEATLPPNPERTVALRKLLEAKDCAVRARLYKEEERTA